MNTTEFANILLPQLLKLHLDNELELHCLFDIDLWKKVFPDQMATDPEQIRWNQIQFTCNPLQDGTLLFTYILPEPTQKRQTKFAAIRLNPQERDERRAIYYTLRKPSSVLDPWDIYHMPISAGESKMQLKFLRKIEGGDTLRNFVFTVQQCSFDEPVNSTSILEGIKERISDMFSTQN